MSRSMIEQKLVRQREQSARPSDTHASQGKLNVLKKELVVYNENNDKVDLSKLSDTYMIERII